MHFIDKIKVWKEEPEIWNEKDLEAYNNMHIETMKYSLYQKHQKVPAGN